MDQRARLPDEVGREIAYAMAFGDGLDLHPISAARSLRFRSLRAIGGTSPEPWVIDANELRGAILHTAGGGKPNLLARAASAGGITWYIADHAAREVDEHLEDWAVEGRVDPAAAWTAWEQTYQPMLRLVQGDLIELAFTDDERQRLDVLAAIDPDDLPTARLAIALGARLVTRDKALLKATYGSGRTSKEHGAALVPTAGALNAAGQLREMEVLSVVLPAALIAELASLVRRVPLLGILGASAAALGLRAPERRDRLRANVQGFWSGLGTAAQVWLAVHTTIDEQLARFEPVLGSVAATADGLGVDARPRILMWTMARRGDADASAADLAVCWPAAAQGLRSSAAIRSILHTDPLFTKTGRGRFQLGVPLRATEAIPGAEGVHDF